MSTTQYIQHLRFNPPTNRETWPKVVAALEYFYGPNKIGFSDMEPLIHATFMVNATLAIQYEDWRNYYRIARSDDYIPGGQYGLPEPIDGWKWVEEMTKSDGLNFIDDVWGRMDESQEMDYSFLMDQNLVGLQFYNPTEYKEEGVFYTIIREYRNSKGEPFLIIEWMGDYGEMDQAVMRKYELVEGFNKSFYVDLSNFDPEKVLNQLYESKETNYSYLRDKNMTGMKFFNPLEYDNTKIVYTVTDDFINDNQEPTLSIEWVNPRGRNKKTITSKNDIINQLNADFYVILPDIDTEKVFNSLYESEEDEELYGLKHNYTKEDIKFFSENNVKFYELIPKTTEPFKYGEEHISAGVIPDESGYVVYHIGIQKEDERYYGQYAICWRTHSEEKCHSGYKNLIYFLNTGRVIPADLHNSKIDTSGFFDQLNESEEDRLKTGDVLYFKNSEIRAYTDDAFTVGKFYPITYINYLRNDIRISDDIGGTHHYTIKPDGRGFSYKTWFIDIPEDIQNIDFFGPLYEQEGDEFEWAREILRNSTTTTLGNLFYGGLIEDGDIVYVQGKTDNGQGKMVELNNVKFIFHSVGNEFGECTIEVTPEIKEIFKSAISPENKRFILISADENLNVLNIIKADQNKK